MTIGTLRDQIIYPDTKQDMLDRGITDGNLEEMIDKVREISSGGSRILK